MVVDWQIARGERVCAASGCVLEPGTNHYSAIREENQGFARIDFSEAAWPEVDKGGFFSFWRTQVPRPEEKSRRAVIDIEAFYTFFASLDDPQEPRQQLFRYLVALILTRKRVLRLEQVEKGADGDHLRLFDRRREQQVRVFCPEVSDAQLAEAQENLDQIFECQSGIVADE